MKLFEFLITIFISLIFSIINIESVEISEVRCKCICPVPGVVTNTTNGTTRKLYIRNVTPNECVCDFVVLPQLSSDVQSKAKEFCPLCECKYESRITSIICFVVIFIIGVISFLTMYMIFLMILDPWIHKRQTRNIYKNFNEEVSLEEHQQQDVSPSAGAQELQLEHQLSQSARHRVSSQSSSMAIMDNINVTTIGGDNTVTGSSSDGPLSVFNRVGQTQNKWKRQVKEQRRKIFDDHTILN